MNVGKFELSKVETWNAPCVVNGKRIGLVQIGHWTRPRIEYNSRTDKWERQGEQHCWNLYAYLHPAHSKFAAFAAQSVECGDYMESELFDSADWHGGITYARKEYNSAGVCDQVKLGCDYAHHMDERFESFSTLEEAGEVHADAMRLFNWLVDQHVSGTPKLLENPNG